MNRLDVKKFLNNCPDKDFINFLISHTNLSELELKVIYFKTNKCFTDEKIKHLMDLYEEFIEMVSKMDMTEEELTLIKNHIKSLEK